ncbi:hypothetical protein V2G26_018757 [Clonostachys chloroleuca]
MSNWTHHTGICISLFPKEKKSLMRSTRIPRIQRFDAIPSIKPPPAFSISTFIVEYNIQHEIFLRHSN